MSLLTRSVTDLLAAFQSAEPTPGGGSASALAGAMGASLLTMVAGLPKSRAASDEERAQLDVARRRCAKLANQLAVLVDHDSAAYEAVLGAYRQPKATDEEKAARSDAIQAALRGAIAVPRDVIRCCLLATLQGVVIAALSNRSAASDVLVGFELLLAGLRGAKLNVEINLSSVKDTEYVRQIRDAVAVLERNAAETVDAARARLGSGPST